MQGLLQLLLHLWRCGAGLYLGGLRWLVLEVAEVLAEVEEEEREEVESHRSTSQGEPGEENGQVPQGEEEVEIAKGEREVGQSLDQNADESPDESPDLNANQGADRRPHPPLDAPEAPATVAIAGTAPARASRYAAQRCGDS